MSLDRSRHNATSEPKAEFGRDDILTLLRDAALSKLRTSSSSLKNSPGSAKRFDQQCHQQEKETIVPQVWKTHA